MLAMVFGDLASASSCTRLINSLKESPTACFKVKLFGKLSSFIGWNTRITCLEIKIDQRGYAKHLILE